jgi:hypothetical protein
MRKNDFFFFLPFSIILNPRLRARDMARKSERRWTKSEDRLNGWKRKRDSPKKSEGLWDFWTKHSNLRVLSTREEPNWLNKEQRVNNKKKKIIQPISRWSWSVQIMVWVRPHAQDLTENHRCEALRSIGTEKGWERLREGLGESGGKATGGEGYRRLWDRWDQISLNAADGWLRAFTLLESVEVRNEESRRN